MVQFDQRRLRISVEIDDKMVLFEALDIKVVGEKLASHLCNNCLVEIMNLKAETRNYLLTETSPFNKNRSRKKIIVEAGRQSDELSRVFIGDIFKATPSSQLPDIGIKLDVQTGFYERGKLVARSGAFREKLSKLSSDIARDAELTLDFQALDKNITNYSFTGGAIKQIDELAKMGEYDVFVDDEVLVVKNKNEPRKNRIKMLDKHTGMIGLPEITDVGIKVKYLFESSSKIGGLLRIKSEINPVIDGDYEIYKLNFELSSQEQAWYYTAEAKRL